MKKKSILRRIKWINLSMMLLFAVCSIALIYLLCNDEMIIYIDIRVALLMITSELVTTIYLYNEYEKSVSSTPIGKHAYK